MQNVVLVVQFGALQWEFKFESYQLCLNSDKTITVSWIRIFMSSCAWKKSFVLGAVYREFVVEFVPHVFQCDFFLLSAYSSNNAGDGPTFDAEEIDENQEVYHFENEVEDRRLVPLPVLTRFPASSIYPSIVWDVGDDMSFKMESTFRVATLNLGLHMSKDPARWDATILGLKNLIDDLHIDVLCIQELHLYQDSRLAKHVINEFASRSLKLSFRGAEGDSDTKEKTFSGVAIVTVGSYQGLASLSDSDKLGRNISQLIPLDTKSHPMSGTHLNDYVAVQCVYGYACGSRALGLEDRVLIKDQAEQTERLHNWGAERSNTQFICGDFNLIADLLVDCHSATGHMVHDSGMLKQALDILGYEDALRCIVGDKQIHTFHRRKCSDAPEPFGSYYDRILFRGVEINRAGALQPRQFNFYVQCDHSLVVADFEVESLNKQLPSCRYERSLGQASLSFIKKAKSYEDKEGMEKNLEEALLGELTGVARNCSELTYDVISLQNLAPPSLKSEFKAQKLQIQKLLERFYKFIYNPVIAWGDHFEHEMVEVQERKLLLNKMNIKLAYAFRDAEVLIRQASPILESLIDRAMALHDAWNKLLSVITELHGEKFCVVADTTYLIQLISAPSYLLVNANICQFEEQKGKIQVALCKIRVILKNNGFDEYRAKILQFWAEKDISKVFI
jgi:exonuclease III